MGKPCTVTLLLFSLIMCVFAACTLPIGAIYGLNETDYESEPMWLVPRRILYQIDEKFMRYQDFQIFIVENNAVFEIKPTDPLITVELSGNHGLSNEFHYPVESSQHQFFSVGRINVNVDYNGRKGWYAIEVFSPNNGNGIGGDGGIGIIWAD